MDNVTDPFCWSLVNGFGGGYLALESFSEKLSPGLIRSSTLDGPLFGVFFFRWMRRHHGGVPAPRVSPGWEVQSAVGGMREGEVCLNKAC